MPPPPGATDRLTALRAFLVALKLPQYEEVMLGTGFGDTSLFVTFDQEDLQTMREVLLTAGVPPGHVERIMTTVGACQDKELRNKNGSSPLKFNYGKQMPLLQTLRDEVRALREELPGLAPLKDANRLSIAPLRKTPRRLRRPRPLQWTHRRPPRSRLRLKQTLKPRPRRQKRTQPRPSVTSNPQPRRCQPLRSLLRMPRGPAARPGKGFGIRLAERRKRGSRGAQLLGTESNGNGGTTAVTV